MMIAVILLSILYLPLGVIFGLAKKYKLNNKRHGDGSRSD